MSTIERPTFPSRAESADSISHQRPPGDRPDERPAGESPKPAEGLSRRNMLGALAVLPTALPVALPAATADPIFAAIQACREAKQASDAAYARVSQLYKLAEEQIGSGREQFKAHNAFLAESLGQHPDRYTGDLASALWDSYEAFAYTVPTTLAGLFAMLAFADEVADCEPEAFNDVAIFSTFAIAAKALLGGRS